MKLPSDLRQLKDIFIRASVPALETLPGEYQVHLFFPWPNLRWLSHRKVIYRESGRLAGYNVCLKRAWGYLSLYESTCDDLDQRQAVALSYDRPENPFFLRGLRDYLRCLEKNRLYLGRFYYEIGRVKVFLGYFSLEKVQ